MHKIKMGDNQANDERGEQESMVRSEIVDGERKKRKLGNAIIAFDEFEVDKNDYEVLVSIDAVNTRSQTKCIEKTITIKKDDKDRRVFKLGWHGRSDRSIVDKCVQWIEIEKKITMKEDVCQLRWYGPSGLSPAYVLSDKLGNLTGLEVLEMNFLEIVSLPSSIGNLMNLKKLDLAFNSELQDIPVEIGNLTRLEYLSFRQCGRIKFLPSSIGHLRNLREMNLNYTSMSQGLPEEIGNLTNLKVLSLCCEHIESLPTSIGNLMNLEAMDLSDTGNLYHLPDEIGNLVRLESLKIETPMMPSLPNSIGNLQNLKELNLRAFPVIHGDSNLRSLPDEIGDLMNLKALHLGLNENIDSIPDAIGNLTKLEFLELSYTNIVSLPSSMGNLTNLKCLMLRGIESLRSLPDHFKRLARLEYLEIRETGMTTIPSVIKNLKNLQVLHLDTRFLGDNDQKQLMELLEQCPRLESLGPLKNNVEMQCCLVRNRMRSRLFFPQNSHEILFPTLSLWPSFFANMKAAMRNIKNRSDSPFNDTPWSSCEIFCDEVLDPADGIFRLLIDHGGKILSRAIDKSY